MASRATRRATRAHAGTSTRRASRNGKPAARPAGASKRGTAWEAQKQAWAKRYEQSGERRDLYPFTISGIPIKPLYTPEDLAGMDLARDLGFPGAYPFTRGVRDTMYRGRMFTMRQFAGFGLARESNQRYHYLLEHGQTGLSIAFDNPRSWATTATIRSRTARSAGAGSRWTACATWRSCSTASIRVPSRPR